MKSIAMLAMSGMLASSLAYVAPALADDYNDNTMVMADAGQSMQNQNPADPTMPNENNNYSMQNNPSTDNNSMNTSSSSDDVGSPDTATGDDDY